MSSILLSGNLRNVPHISAELLRQGKGVTQLGIACHEQHVHLITE